jgi:uncharacterized membrane protein YeaQ/YmgE (transglycosylase-associated protein family)
VIVGSSPGFWITGLPGLEPAGGILRFLAAIAGAALLTFILGKFGIFRKG